MGLLILPMTAFADGKFYPLLYKETVPPDLPYQRAIIAHDGQHELLILQSKFKGEAVDFGWVIPVPSVPRMTSLDDATSNKLFDTIDRVSKPNISSIKKLLIYFIFISAAGLGVVVIAKTANRKAQGKSSTRLFFMGKSGTFIFIVILFLLIAYFTAGSLLRVFLPTFGLSENVGILDSRYVGIYEVKVIESDSAEDLLLWLDKNNYYHDNSDKEAFDKYINQGMCFVVAKIAPGYLEDGELKTVRNGLLNPLVLLFRSEEVFYPLALTGTIGKDTVVLLYVFHENKLTDPSGRMPLRYFGKQDISKFMKDIDPVQNIVLDSFTLNQKSLTKLRARLTAGQMKEDLMLEKAPNDEPYRETIYRWDAPPTTGFRRDFKC